MRMTDEQLNQYESEAHKQVVEDDWVVVEWVYDLVKEVRDYKARVEHMQKAIEWLGNITNDGLVKTEVNKMLQSFKGGTSL